jgi:homoserine kinase
MTLLRGPVTVRVPATSANLGPGFDCLGLALDLHDDVGVAAGDPADGDAVDVAVTGEGAGAVPSDASHLVVRAVHRALDELGEPRPPLRLVCTNRIPHGRGLGSSAAAVVAGLLAGRTIVDDGADRLGDADLLRLATAMEGHPDNVAACLRGGLTFAWGDPVRVLRLDADPRLAPVALVPSTRSSTKKVRGLLPSSVPYADAVFNAARAALLPTALTSAPELLMSATEDRLHQQYRAPAMPESAELVASLRSAGSRRRSPEPARRCWRSC